MSCSTCASQTACQPFDKIRTLQPGDLSTDTIVQKPSAPCTCKVHPYLGPLAVLALGLGFLFGRKSR